MMTKMRMMMMTISGEIGKPKIKASPRRGLVGGEGVGRIRKRRHILLHHLQQHLVTMFTKVASQPKLTMLT
jgi:hypothetical protein